MDFSLPYTNEQETFRKEVRSWLAENVPSDLKDPVDPRDFTIELNERWREVHKELGKKGWLYPTFPKEYGGGGLTGDHETIITEEMNRAGVPENFTSGNTLPPMQVWGSDEQKQKFLKPIVTGEKTVWNKLTEPNGGADLANVQGTAVKDGDEWVLNGEHVYVSGRGKPGFLLGPMKTDPDAPRHRNLGYFIIPVPDWNPDTGSTGLDGLSIYEMNLINGHDQHNIVLNDVRIPGDNLFGGETQGWQVAGTTMESEHGGRGKAFPIDTPVENLVEHLGDENSDGTTVGSDPVLQQAAMTAVMESHVQNVLLRRVFWMYQNKHEISWHSGVANVHGRESSLRIESRVREVYGPHALLNSHDPDAPHGGQHEVNARNRAGQNHAGGSTNIGKVVLARRIGISRTIERPAPTPSTASA
tara:strand:- start:2715 stop:3959 length:1245 start_codon:yes stop_codon:yes gene_type:complete